MTENEREAWLNTNQELCQRYNETGDETLLEKIAITEMILLHSEVES